MTNECHPMTWTSMDGKKLTWKTGMKFCWWIMLKHIVGWIIMDESVFIWYINIFEHFTENRTHKLSINNWGTPNDPEPFTYQFANMNLNVTFSHTLRTVWMVLIVINGNSPGFLQICFACVFFFFILPSEVCRDQPTLVFFSEDGTWFNEHRVA